VLLLCTDGVHGVLDSETLRDLLGQQLDVDATARILLNTAMDRGSRDNVTALVVRFQAEP
jgi:serine/threonine protein phosphatase PrpC